MSKHNQDWTVIGFGLWILFCLALALSFFGVVIWAIIELVQWVTSK